MQKFKIWSCALAGLLIAASPGLFAQQQFAKSSSPSVDFKPELDRLKTRISSFGEHLNRTLDSSALDGSQYEDHLNRWADTLEDAVGDMAKHYVRNGSQQETGRFLGDLEDTMIAATGMNRLMLRREMGSLQPEWAAIRSDLNTVAAQFHRPPLANVTVTVVSLAPATVLTRPEVRNVMERLETSTDRFQNKFKTAVRHSTANLTSRQREWNRWARQLEDVSDDLLDDYKDKDYTHFQAELENTMAVAAMMNRIMVSSDLGQAAEIEWKNVRNQLNTVATAFGYAVLPSDLTPLRASLF